MAVYLRQRQIRGQRKIPRLSNDRRIADVLLKYKDED